MLAAPGVASSSSRAGQGAQAVPSAAVFGSPVRMKAAMLPIMAFDSASRPGRLATLKLALANSDGPKLPNTKPRSKACAAP